MGCRSVKIYQKLAGNLAFLSKNYYNVSHTHIKDSGVSDKPSFFALGQH